MVNFKEWENFIFQVETIISENSNLIKKMEEDYTSGQAKSQIYMKGSLSKEREMEEVLSGGLMEAGMRVSLEMEFKVDMVYFIETVVMFSMKDLGTMECLMERVLNSLKMDRNMKVHLNKINSMEMECFIKMIQ